MHIEKPTINFTSYILIWWNAGKKLEIDELIA